MINSSNLIISIINLISLILGVITVGFVFRLNRLLNTNYLNYFFFFVICAVVSGFCDWIIFNWVLLLIPGIPSNTIDLIYHIFWDLIGFPAALLALFYLIKTINEMLNIRISRLKYSILLGILFLVILLSYLGFYFRLQNISSVLNKLIWIIYTYVIPFTILGFLVISYIISFRKKSKIRAFDPGKFILILFLGFSLWIFLSLVPVRMGIMRHLIIFTYYFAIFLPVLYLVSKQNKVKSISENYESGKLEDFLKNYGLTSREIELALLLMEGKSNTEISEKLFISLQTVKNYVSSIYKKTSLKNRVQFINFVRKNLKRIEH